MIPTDAFVSDCDWVRKSRLRSNPLPFARVPATRPSGFWITLKMTTAPSRILSTSGSVPYGVVASFSMIRMFESTPSYSLPWIAPWMKSGTLTSSPKVASCACAHAGSVSTRARRCVQRKYACFWAPVFSWLMTTLYMSRPVADLPTTSTDMRPSRLRAWMSSSVHLIA